MCFICRVYYYYKNRQVTEEKVNKQLLSVKTVNRLLQKCCQAAREAVNKQKKTKLLPSEDGPSTHIEAECSLASEF